LKISLLNTTTAYFILSNSVWSKFVVECSTWLKRETAWPISTKFGSTTTLGCSSVIEKIAPKPFVAYSNTRKTPKWCHANAKTLRVELWSDEAKFLIVTSFRARAQNKFLDS